jgi:hypothetical protein
MMSLIKHGVEEKTDSLRKLNLQKYFLYIKYHFRYRSPTLKGKLQA